MDVKHEPNVPKVSERKRTIVITLSSVFLPRRDANIWSCFIKISSGRLILIQSDLITLFAQAKAVLLRRG